MNTHRGRNVECSITNRIGPGNIALECEPAIEQTQVPIDDHIARKRLPLGQVIRGIA